MNNRNTAMSLMNNLSTCEVIFASGIDFNMERIDTTMKLYTYVYDKERLSLAKGDRVVIPGSGKYSVGVVAKVHDFNKIDLSVSYNYALVTDKVDIDSSVDEKLEQASTLLNEAKRSSAKRQLLNEFTGNMSDIDRAKLESGFKNLGIALDSKE